ncbi:hypothetical protein [Vibrio salinus]|uniref:hypothetical protein n=1 Tax=Vibrio salinus TaxID=2899784 RepID=UPI001E29905D|nr:hypothetical protein [Vibrio salinus]MCE0495227.1 hypothetical protein [Vibrio salinus]
MKKTIFTISALTLALALTGCDDSKKSAQTETHPQPGAATVTTQSATPTDETDGMAKVPATTDDAATSASDAVGNAQNDVKNAVNQAAEDVNKLPATATGSASDTQEQEK